MSNGDQEMGSRDEVSHNLSVDHSADQGRTQDFKLPRARVKN